MAPIIYTQIGKLGVTKGFINSLKNSFKKHKIVRISVLKSCCRNKTELKEIAEKIKKSLGNNYKFRTIGYTIIFKK